MKLPHPTTVDFETFGIEPRPYYPPSPVGVSIKLWGRRAKYYAFGHPTGNNCFVEDAVIALRAVWDNPDGLLFHNAKFDLDVAEVHFNLKPPSWDHVHDTTFLAFLEDPHSKSVALKPLAERYLRMPPGERDAVADWLVAKQPVDGVRISRSSTGREPFGKYIAWAPGTVVGRYANGDVRRTEALFRYLYPRIVKRGMLPAYNRERRLLPILLDMERRGIPVDVARLRSDVATYNVALTKCDTWVLKKLKQTRDDNYGINLDSGVQLIAALEAVGLVDVAALGVTETGLPRTDKAALAAGITDPKLAAVLRYRTQLQTCLRTFMEPWLATAEKSGGLIYTNWNQTRGERGGTRTGRLSSTPNFQNVPQEFNPISRLPLRLPALPLCRGYLIAPKGKALCGRDFASQELRILAHFEGGAMAQGYLDDPAVDFHQLAADMITRTTGVLITRKNAKTIGFSILYGSGVPHLAEQLGVTVGDALNFLKAYFRVFPGVNKLRKSLKSLAAAKRPICTVGGREYFCEPPRIVEGKIRHYEYKLLNYLVQGSASDQTKDAMIRFDDAAGPGLLLASVHDEILVAAPVKQCRHYMGLLKAAMNDAELNVPMLSDGERGMNWAAMEAWDG